MGECEAYSFVDENGERKVGDRRWWKRAEVGSGSGNGNRGTREAGHGLEVMDG